MADITENQVREFIAVNLQDASGIPAVDHRAVENKIIDFMVQELGKVAKSKVLLLESFSVDRNYSIATGLPESAIIDSAVAMLVCKVSNNGFAVGDVVTVCTPSKWDSTNQPSGVGVQYNNLNNTVIKIMTNDELVVMTSYNSAPGAIANNLTISGIDVGKWSLKIIVGYK
ncbi:hypothetical protein [Flavobacterium sp. CSZ]|uniref:hypothetical protein n=1 Tax=Flavobacterium sp. CSZ TaxID=2783791 RepID=UPI00188B63C3|nr:hypothetical protein [Flavobacterium sp. CSZ]MBF4484438.1 hypothetical protein [Flavobacterium sp. CSZ]